MDDIFSCEYVSTLNNVSEIEDWVHQFLCGPGNNLPFSEGLRLAPRQWEYHPEMPLIQLQRCCGPEPDMPFKTSREDWERGILEMQNSLNQGWNPPPVIAEKQGGVLIISDGNHRFEALRREGHTFWPTIVWGTVG